MNKKDKTICFNYNFSWKDKCLGLGYRKPEKNKNVTKLSKDERVILRCQRGLKKLCIKVFGPACCVFVFFAKCLHVVLLLYIELLLIYEPRYTKTIGGIIILLFHIKTLISRYTYGPQLTRGICWRKLKRRKWFHMLVSGLVWSKGDCWWRAFIDILWHGYG